MTVASLFTYEKRSVIFMEIHFFFFNTQDISWRKNTYISTNFFPPLFSSLLFSITNIVFAESFLFIFKFFIASIYFSFFSLRFSYRALVVFYVLGKGVLLLFHFASRCAIIIIIITLDVGRRKGVFIRSGIERIGTKYR